MANEPSSNAQNLFIGIDGGGTKCRASIMTADLQVLGTGLGGPANPFQGIELAQDSILAAVSEALEDARLPQTSAGDLIAGAGLAGVNVPSLFNVMSDWKHPFHQLFLTTDLHIACLGAHNRDQGAVMICGTGSCGYAYVNQQTLLIGGHGFPMGDKGSGAWMGLEAIRAVLLATDGLGPQTRLTDAIGDFLQARGLAIVEKLFGARQGDYARFASLVLDAAAAGDAVATCIVEDGAAYMSEMARQLWATQPGRMSMIGGLSERLLPWLQADVVGNLSPALYPPEFGAVYFARHVLNNRNSANPSSSHS